MGPVPYLQHGLSPRGRPVERPLKHAVDVEPTCMPNELEVCGHLHTGAPSPPEPTSTSACLPIASDYVLDNNSIGDPFFTQTASAWKRGCII